MYIEKVASLQSTFLHVFSIRLLMDHAIKYHRWKKLKCRCATLCCHCINKSRVPVMCMDLNWWPVVWPIWSSHPYCHKLHCKEDPVYVFPEMKLRGLVPNFHVCVSVSDLYIPSIGPPILLQKIKGQIVGIVYKSRTDIWMWKLGTRPRSFISGNIWFEFSVPCLCSVHQKGVIMVYLSPANFSLILLTELGYWVAAVWLRVKISCGNEKTERKYIQ
jgi:hypothetical protein